MRVVLAVPLVPMPTVTGGGDRQVIKQCDPRFEAGGFFFIRRGFDQHPPMPAVRLASVAMQFAAHFDQRGRDAARTQRRRDGIDRMALGDRRQIQLRASRLPQAATGDVQGKPPPTDPGPGRVTRGLIRYRARTGMRAKAP